MHELPLVNINVYTKFYQNILCGWRPTAISIFSQFWPWHCLSHWKVAFGTSFSAGYAIFLRVITLLPLSLTADRQVSRIVHRLFVSQSYSIHFSAGCAIVANNILIFCHFFFQTIHMKCQDLFSQVKNNKIKIYSAAVVISTYRVTQSY